MIFAKFSIGYILMQKVRLLSLTFDGFLFGIFNSIHFHAKGKGIAFELR